MPSAPQLLPGVKQSGHCLPALLGREEQDPLGPEAAEHDVQPDYHRRQEGQQLGQAGGNVLKLFSSSMTVKVNKLECFSWQVLFQANVAVVGKARGLPVCSSLVSLFKGRLLTKN